MTGLLIENLSVRYGARSVVSDLTLPELKPGEVTVLAGPNAAGKSTLLRAIAQLNGYQGRIALEGQDLARLSAPGRAAKIGFMPQTLPAGSALSVLESVITALSAAADRVMFQPERQALAVLCRLGIEDLALRTLDQLSGGQRQMVGLAQAIVRDPRLLLLDEPTSALDLSRQTRLLSELRRLAAEGRIVIAVLHDLSLAAQWADRMIVLERGRLFASGRPDEVVTADMLTRIYGVEARVERCSRGRLVVMVDDVR